MVEKRSVVDDIIIRFVSFLYGQWMVYNNINTCKLTFYAGVKAGSCYIAWATNITLTWGRYNILRDIIHVFCGKLAIIYIYIYIS